MKFILGRFRVRASICFVAPAQAVAWTDHQSLGVHTREDGSVSGLFELDSFGLLFHMISERPLPILSSLPRSHENRSLGSRVTFNRLCRVLWIEEGF